jgi:small-conductance mechanosensitive channel
MAVIGGSVLVAWLIARRLRIRWQSRSHAPGAQIPFPGLSRLLMPVLAIALLGGGALVLRAGHLIATVAEARLVRIAGALLLTLAALRMLGYAVRRAFPGQAWVARFERIASAITALGVALYVTGALADVIDWLRATQFPLGNGEVSLLSVIKGGATTSLALIAALWAGSLVDERIREAKSVPPNVRTVVGRSARAILVVLAVLVGLSLSGIDLTILSVFGGALGVGLGLGLQRIASNYVSGFILLLDRGLRIGDFITVDKHTGVVEEIRTRYTLLRSLDSSEAIIPNEVLVSSPVVNLTLADRLVMLALRVALPPDVDIKLVQSLMIEAARQPRVLANPAPVALLAEFSAATLVFELDFWISDPENGRLNAQSDVSIALLEALRRQGIPLAVPASEVRIPGLKA